MLLGVFHGYKCKECELFADLKFHPIKIRLARAKSHQMEKYHALFSILQHAAAQWITIGFTLFLSLFLSFTLCGNRAVSERDSRLIVAFAMTTRTSHAEKRVTYTLSMSLLSVCLCVHCPLCV